MKQLLYAVVVLFALLFTPQLALADYPKPTGYVNDYANVLSLSFKKTEEQKLTEYTKQTSNEIAVVTVTTTGDMAIDDYAQGLFDQWKPGVSGKDNGIIILFAMNDHKDRIQTGCGLEGALSDVQEQSILDNNTQPLMRAGKYDQAIDTTVTAIQNQIKGKELSPCTIGSQKAIDQARTNTTTAKNRSSGLGFWLIIFACILVVIVMIILASESDSDDGGFGLGTLVGGIAGSMIGGSDDDDDSDSSSSSSGGFGGFSGGSSSGGGATGGW